MKRGSSRWRKEWGLFGSVSLPQAGTNPWIFGTSIKLTTFYYSRRSNDAFPTYLVMLSRFKCSDSPSLQYMEETNIIATVVRLSLSKHCIQR